MGKSEKLVVLGVLSFVVLLFVWSLQSDGSPSVGEMNRVEASERGPAGGPSTNGPSTNGPRMNGRAPRGAGDKSSGSPNPDGLAVRKNDEGGQPLNSASSGDSEVAGRGADGSTRMLLAETKEAGAGVSGSNGADSRGSVVVSPSTERRGASGSGASSLADPAARATGRSSVNSQGISRARVRMQPGWDLITTAGLQGTLDPSMFLFEVSKADATWATVAKDLYGDAAKASLLQHNNEGMETPTGSIFVPAKDDLGLDASVRTVEVLQGESLWQVAKRTLGKGSEWKAVWEANRDVIPDPDFVAPGTVLRIPLRLSAR